MENENVTEIPLSQILDFPDHPYQVKDDECMNNLVSSIKERGLIQPIIVRPIEDNLYEMVSGHRRKRAFELAGLKSIPAKVVELTRDEAILVMVDSNLQREVILPSEKAKAYKMRLDAMKRQGQRSDLTSRPMGDKLNNKRAGEILGEVVGESERQVQRYIRLTELIPEMLDLVDEGKVAMRPAVEISYLPKESQEQLVKAMDFSDATPSHYQAIRMKNYYRDGKLTEEVIDTIMDEAKPNQKEKSPFRDKRIEGLIPQSVPKDKQCDYVLKALRFYNKYRERARDNRER
ncbi:ParB/RepB/Spo0J family partition protein [Ruminococcus bromii]|uniref:ParB/RepB/Spo0J family partition protein n=1 Tax=Ruminococcus bromii TaxID=40518 RepID=UPI003FD7DD0D